MAFGLLPAITTNYTISQTYNGGAAYTVGALTVYQSQLYYNISPTTNVADGFDPAFGGSLFVYSNNNLTVVPSAGGLTRTCRDNNPHTTGNFYIEHILTTNNGQDMNYGFCNGNVTNNQFPGDGTDNGVVWRFGPNAWGHAGGQTLTGMPLPNIGDVIAIQTRLNVGGNMELYISNVTANPNQWYGNNGVADPVAHTNPMVIPTLNAPTYACFCFNQNVSPAGDTMNVAVFDGAPSPGYVGWGSNLTPPNDPSHWALILPDSGPTTYALRPANPVVGQQCTFSDATVNTWGANVTAGGGADNVLCWWNGTNWRVMGS